MNITNSHIWAAYRLAAFAVIVFLAVLGFAEVHQRADGDRQAAISYCEDGNRRTAELKSFFNDLIREPRAEDYAYIVDPKLREGALAQSRASYAKMKERLDRFGQPRDCQGLFNK
jgi:hypothetical protein